MKNIQADIKKISQSETEIKITVPWEEWKGFIDKAVQDISKDVKTKGFRSGKTPRDIIEKQVGINTILNTAAQKVIEKTYLDIITREKVDAIGSPGIEILKLAEGNDFEYRAKTATVPEVKIKPWRKDIQKINKEEEGKKVEVSEEDVEEEIEKIANSRVMFAVVDRAAKKGDSVEVDFQVKHNNVPIENGTGKKHPLVLGSSAFIPGFEENIIGMKAQEEKDFELNFPEKYHEKSLAGKPATFNVKLLLVQEKRTPEVNDGLARSLGKFKDLEDLKKNVREGLLKEGEEKKKNEKRTKLLDKLVDLLEVEIPKVLIHSELHKMIEEFRIQIQSMGMNLEDYLSKMKKTKDDLEKEWAPQAEKRIKASMALDKISKEMEINVSSDMIEEEMNKTLQQYKDIKNVEKNIDTARLYDYIKGVMVNEEVFKYLEKL